MKNAKRTPHFLIAYFPMLLVFAETLTWLGSNFGIDPNRPGGHEFPIYMSVLTYIFIVPASFMVALLLSKTAGNASSSRHVEAILSQIAILLIAVMLGVYGFFRLERSGVIVFVWDATLSCCYPTGNVSGQFLLVGSATVLLTKKGYYMSRFIVSRMNVSRETLS